jgi:hypothetical protein
MLIIWLRGSGCAADTTSVHTAVGGRLPAAADRGVVASGPLSGWLSDRFGARWFAVGGMV